MVRVMDRSRPEVDQRARQARSARSPLPTFVSVLPVQAAIVAALVCGLAWLSLDITQPFGRVSPIWLGNAVWLVFLLRNPVRRWPALLLAGLAGNMTANFVIGDRPEVGAGLSLANALEVVACAWCMRRRLGGRFQDYSLTQLGAFGFFAAACSAGSAVIASMVLRAFEHAPAFPTMVAWTAADTLGLLILVPPLLLLSQGVMKDALKGRPLRNSVAVLATLAAALAASVILPAHPIMLLSLPVLVLAALQFEFAGAALGMLAITASIVTFLALGWTPFSFAGHTPREQVLGAQAFLVAADLMALPLASMLMRRRQLEAELVETNRLAKLAETLAGHGYWRLPYGGQFTWSDQMFSIYGLDPADGPPGVDQVLEFCHPDDRERLSRHRAEKKGESAEVEVRILRPDGEVRHVISRSVVELDEEGAVAARFGTLTDVTEVKLVEAQLRESEQRYRFIADHAPDMISRTSIAGDPIYVSPSSVRAFGYTPEEMRLQNAQDMVHPEDFGRVMEGIFSLVTERKTRLDEPLIYRARHKDGSWVWIETNPTLILDEAGEPIEFIDIVRNVTQAKLFEAELEQAKTRAEAAAAAKSAFLANMSHELRTPLTSIIGFSRLMGTRGDLPSEAQHYVERISDASEALLAIINDVLDFSKLEAGQVSLETQPISIRRLVDETTGLMAIQAAAKGLDLRTVFDPKTPERIDGDIARLRQVLLNFLSNAVKFTQQGSVTVETRYRKAKGGGRLRMTVSDTGGGIAPDAVARLFERFSQAEVSINRTHGGTGLGLAISKGIVELMGGKIGVDTTPGEGSSFWFEIPAQASAAEAVHEPVSDAAHELPSLHLLVVDDTAVNRELVKLMLTPLGFTIEEASGGADGVKIAMTQHFDLILMDVRMPGVDGLEATRVIRGASLLNARTPILALTADVQPENALSCREAGMNDVVAKPISPAELIGKIVQWGSARPGVDETAPPAVRSGAL